MCQLVVDCKIRQNLHWNLLANDHHDWTVNSQVTGHIQWLIGRAKL